MAGGEWVWLLVPDRKIVMAIVMTMDSNQISDLTGWDYSAQLSYGQNGDMYGPMEITTSTPDYNVQGDYMMWDENPYDGVDSGWRGASLSYDEHSVLTWGVNGQGSTRPVAASDGIDYVDIRTAVKNQAAMLWSNAVVLFYKDGVITQQVWLGSFGVETMATPGVKDQITRITPINSNNDKVVVSGMVKLMAPEGSFPAEDGMFSQILIYT